MWIIDFFKSNCKNCYACVRACPVNAIKVQAEQAKIIKERCIGCGRCLKACPKNAKHVQSELDKVKAYLQQEEKVVASVAPSFAALFDKDSHKLPNLLRALGFEGVEETVVGAELITEVYEAYSKMPGDQCYMTSCCPTVNALIQKHYPEVIPFLIPVVSPAVCHAKLIKRRYGKETKVVFIGPCLSKKIEGIEEDTIDAVLTFEELLEWIKEKQIDWEVITPSSFDIVGLDQYRYPIVGGMTYTIKDKSLPRKIIQIDGVEECIDMMPHIMKGAFKNTLLEIHGCRQSCISGPGMPQDGVNIYERRERIRRYAETQELERDQEVVSQMITEGVNLHKEFQNLKHSLKMPSDEEIQVILNSIGKETKLDELNCGSCGYKTCRDKAIAVYNEMAEPNMCLPFMRQKAETLTNIIFEATPNLILMVNEALEIIEMNPAARKFFDLTKDIIHRLPVSALMSEESFNEVMHMKKNILNEKVILHTLNATVVQSIIWSDYHKTMVWIANDVTYDEKKNKQLQSMKIEAIDMAQQVINKQMTVAQEIASLLGETTAETKVTLTKLKQLIKEEEAIKR